MLLKHPIISGASACPIVLRGGDVIGMSHCAGASGCSIVSIKSQQCENVPLYQDLMIVPLCREPAVWIHPILPRANAVEMSHRTWNQLCGNSPLYRELVDFDGNLLLV